MLRKKWSGLYIYSWMARELPLEKKNGKDNSLFRNENKEIERIFSGSYTNVIRTSMSAKS